MHTVNRGDEERLREGGEVKVEDLLHDTSYLILDT